jgi:exonuclease SbcC
MNSTAGQVFGAAREALASSDAATARSREADRQALECAMQNGFESTDSASVAMLTADEVHKLEHDLREREAQRSRAEAVLQDEHVAEAASGEEPDLAGLSADFAVLEEAHASCVGRVHQAAQRVARVEELEAELSDELAAWAPTRSAYAVALTLSTFAEGKGGDNSLQMRLSAYVLASRLGQVVASANERLKAMSDGRYTLEHSASRGAGELRGGLSLLVRDEWTGESRDPATLSGGETFVVSLALALGLADVVTQEAGGSSIDTLFIDEGFGTLDAETLDDVMNTLDGLRDGGRVVGIVSHVPEMRTRITSQLQIRKDRSGSRILATRETL